jgi:DNA-directed RNA polymerase subunit RPC12/RpoP
VNCPECNKIVPITKSLKIADDTIECIYCNHVIPVKKLVWSDGKFHFRILGDVNNAQSKINFAPRILMNNQVTKVFDLPKILAKAITIINKEPNLRCVCEEFFIKDKDIRVELVLENKS